MTGRCSCYRPITRKGRAPCPHWPSSYNAARRVAWVLWAFAAVMVAGLVAYGCAS